MRGIRFDPPSIVFPNTYISATSRFALKVVNETDSIHHISFGRKKSMKDDIELLNQQDILDPEQRSQINNLFEYTNDVFTIEPMELEIWPHSFQSIFIFFSPLLAVRYSSVAYAQIDEEQERVRLELIATGLPPMAQFLTSQIVIGNVFLDSIFEYRVILKNVGKVPVHFSYEHHDTGELGFSFNPEEGSIPVDNEIPIIVKFTASSVGSFNENFIFKIRGATIDHPSLILSGKVIGPSFVINPRCIDFEGVGYGFLYSQTIEIENKSEIPFDFTLRMSHDGSFERREFQLKPEFGTIPKFGKQEITVELIPISIRKYNLKMLLDIARFGKGLAEIPITANCVCPSLRLIPEIFDFKSAFIGYKYTQEIKIRNGSEYAAKFEFVSQDEQSRKYGIIEIDRNTGIVSPNSDAPVYLSLTTQKIGQISVDCFFRVFGSDEPPMKFTFTANSTGPAISFSPNAISFGSIPVFQEKTVDVIVSNNSLIPANFRAHLDSATGGFIFSPNEGTIPPNSEMPLSVTVKLNDVLNFTGNIKLCFDYLNAMTIALKAQGIGSPLISSIDMKDIDFGFVLTEQPAIKHFTLENKSNRSFEVRFTPNKVQTPKSQVTDFVFNIEPEHIVVPGKSSRNFEISLYCTTVTPFSMPLQCHATIGRQRILIFDSLLKGSFVQPLVEFSTTTLEFKHQCIDYKNISSTSEQSFPSTTTETSHLNTILTVNSENRQDASVVPNKALFKTITQPLTVTNNSKLSLPIEVECPSPFTIDCDNFEIEPGESREFLVSFDSSFKTDFVTESIQKNLVFSFIGHPQNIVVTLKGSIVFPNLKFDSTDEIDFGVLMMNTEQTKSITMTNDVDIPVEYEWQLISNDLSTNRIFDIFPLYGVIEPGESLPTHFSFYAIEDPLGKVREYKATAVCHVLGGPDYVVPLVGSSATILYKVSPMTFSFSSTCYSQPVKDTLSITNTSKAAISFLIKIPRNTRFQSFTISPMTGVLAPQDTATLSLVIIPGVPTQFKEQFLVMIGEFEEIQIDVTIDACFSQVLFSLPRDEDDASYLSLIEKEKQKQYKNRRKGVDDFPSSFSHSTLLLQTNQKPYNFSDDQLLEEEKCIILEQMNAVKNFKKQTDNRMSRLFKEVEEPNTDVAHYVIHFNDLILSEMMKQKFKIKSHSAFPITFEMDLNNIKRSGFKIEPSMVKDLMPDSEVEIEVSFISINKKCNDIGEVNYDIPVLFSDGHKLLLTIVTELKLPSLVFSEPHFDFGDVIIGQKKIMTVQFQNMSSASIEFKIGQAENIQTSSALKSGKNSNRITNEKTEKGSTNKNNDTNKPGNNSPFIMVPDSGILPPSSFMNIAIHFSPILEKNFNMQFPIKISYNPELNYVTVSGTGNLMNLIFTPKELVLPSVQPYAAPSTTEVVVSNPNPYPIEFFSLQFDQQLITEETVDPRQAESPFVTYTPKAKTPVAASKFAVCIILNGPPLSGKSTLAGTLSAVLDLPVLNLRDIWENTTDYLSKLYSTLCGRQYGKGLIIDGLDALDDAGENEAFLQSVFKMNKNAQEDVLKSSFTALSHQSQCIVERVLDIILSSLDGHFVFHIAVKLPTEQSIIRKTEQTQAETKAKHAKSKEEKDALFAMTEDEYLALDEEKRIEVDKKRQHYRKKMIARIEKLMEQTTEKTDRKRKDDSNSHQQQLQQQQQQKKKNSKPNQIPTDPLQLQSMAFQYSLGSICQKAQNETERFKVIDPIFIMQQKNIPIIDLDNFEHNMNSLILDGTKPVEDIVNILLMYLPPMTILKETAFKMQIPDDQINDDVTNDSLKMVSKLPQFFTIVKEEAPPPPKGQPKKNAQQNPNQQNQQNSQNQTQTARNEMIDENILKNLTNRWKLPPNGETKLTIKYESTETGTTVDNLLFSIAKCQMQPAVLKVKGICQYPDIDRSTKQMFTKIVKRFDSKSCPAYISSINEFNFGNCLICKDKAVKGQMQYKTTMKIANNSTFNADCQAVFQFNNKEAGKGIWSVEPSNFSIQPSSSVELSIGFHPSSLEVFKTKLVIFIKDNPEPFYVNFVGDSSQPSAETSTTSIDFEKLLVGNEKSKKFEIKNVGKLPLSWRLKGFQQLQPNVTFSILEGNLQHSKSVNIVVKFSSNKPIQLKKPVQIEILDIEKVRTFSTLNLNIAAESFDVNFDVLFPKGQNDSFDFGMLKVNQTKSISINLRNRGKYPVNYKFNITNQDVNRYLKISQPDGTVNNQDKGCQVTFTFNSSCVINFHNMKCITLTVVDSQTKATTASLTYAMNAATSYSMFSLSSSKALQYGTVASNVLHHKEIVITNTGPFSFEYDFHANVAVTEDKKSGKASNQNSSLPSATAAKQKPKKPQTNSLQLGAFSIFPANGTLNPGAAATVSFDLNSPEAGKFNIPVLLNVTEAHPSEKSTSIRLMSDVYIPGLFVSDNERLFPRLPLCIRFDVAKTDITSYLEDENVLHFKPKIVGQKEEVNVRLINNQPIEIDVDLSVKGKAKSIPFDISEKSVHIKGNEFANIVLTFTPTGADNFQAAFEANVKNGTNPATKSLKFGIEGIGTVPSLALQTQLESNKGKGNGYTVNMGKTLVGFDKQKVIAIGNDGLIPTTVQISTKPGNDFEISGVELNRAFSIDPGRQFTFAVTHKPTKMRKSQFEVTANCVENPKSSLQFAFVAEGFCEDIVFDGLEGEDNELHFRGAVVGRSQSVSFTMKNVSDAAIRFQWIASNDLVFSPRVGHISQYQTKEITVTFASEKPVKYIGTKGVCQITKIELLDKNQDNNSSSTNAIDWDDSQKMITFVPRSELLATTTPNNTTSTSNTHHNTKNNDKNHDKNVINKNSESVGKYNPNDVVSVPAVKPEPTYHVLTSGRPKEINIKIFVISDVIKYSIDTTEIAFAPTMMFQSRYSEFKMNNLCQIRIEYQWELEKFETVRTDYANTRPSAFSIEPSSGFIEPGQTTTFKAIFSPMEVDDFLGSFKCIVPYSNSEPSRISMTALSRRPICHFNVPLSDYLSRRHPDFASETLPEDVKVIEIFSKAVRSRTSKKIEIINPTSSLYETRWSIIKDNSDGAIKCENENALVSSGKRYFFSFSYTPNNTKTVECLYQFEIPQHEIKVYFLFVGRITH
ncbi:hypothetical protein TRFO_03593 [Tritrichomonas foetus]|uniref:MSP domain-containing protein n=1 Tax=Tritrichomonas foetus TaxID=1144522 RepID=A0A1J4KNS9_9EUKA|nr:hypothetical protein TRFO_03593 [Tritrichomonas foetus]|eukprot:OHT12584.1 hypothetical protein TRFO_03593 [Tritrichomonas foetus]